MAKVFTYLLFAVVLMGCNLTTQKAQTTQETPVTQEAAPITPVEVDNSPKVYICDSPWAECYHRYTDCEGLELCNRSIIEITLNQAQKMGRRPCGYCAK